MLTVTRDVFKHAVEDGIIAHSPAADIVYLPRKDKNKRLIPSFAEFQSIKNAGAKVFRVKDPKIALDNACKRLNLPNYSARAFRRTFITRALELGIDAQTIAS